MKNVAIFLLILVVGALSILVYYQQASIGEQRRVVQEVTARLESNLKASSLDLQQKCARQAREVFSSDPAVSLGAFNPLNSFTNHYNNKLAKCFVLVTLHILNPKTNTMSDSRYLQDAFEGRSYGVFLWQSDSDKPAICEATHPSGGKRPCQSSDEFDELIKFYMQ